MTPEEIAQKAVGLVGGDRKENYGTPKDNHIRIAELWTAYMFAKGAEDVIIVPEDVANMMILLKMARQIHKNTYENLVDIVGYAILQAELWEKEG